MAAIEIRDLTRIYQTDRKCEPVIALDSFSLDVAAGEVLGLLGPNGAGKTTLVKVLSTVLLPSSGSARVFGHDVVEQVKTVRRMIGVVFGGERGLYWHLTGRQNLEYWAALHDVPEAQTAERVTGLLERVGLGERANDPVEGYSRGMKQRLHLARGLVADADVLFLDEPTIGMDPIAAREFRELMLDLRARGKTILLTTHDMDEAESVCERVALIDQGRLIATETPESLARLVGRHARIEFESADGELEARLDAMSCVAAVHRLPEPGSYRVEVVQETAIPEVLQGLVSAGVTALRTSRPSLAEVYVHFLGKKQERPVTAQADAPTNRLAKAAE
jgi:ABC-2 type transport system ATP-binding protein